MKKIIVSVVAAFAIASCGGGTDSEAAGQAWNAMPEQERTEFCDAIDIYTASFLEEMLVEANDSGVEDGITWIRINHSPSNSDLRALVAIAEENC